MSEAIWIELIGTLPTALWVAFAATVYFTLRGTLIEKVVPRIAALRAMGVEIELAGELLDRATAQRDATVSATDRRTALGRLEHAAELLRGGSVLWVDDRPEGNGALIQLFDSVGMEVDDVLSTQDALRRLNRKSYDIIISDLDRDGDPQAGIRMLRELERHGVDTPVLVYTGTFNPERGVDRRIFAATTSPVDLVHYVIDLMERARLRSL